MKKIITSVLAAAIVATSSIFVMPVSAQVLPQTYTIELGISHSAAIKEDESLWVWGYNGGGQLGNGKRVFGSSVPTKNNG